MKEIAVYLRLLASRPRASDRPLKPEFVEPGHENETYADFEQRMVEYEDMYDKWLVAAARVLVKQEMSNG